MRLQTASSAMGVFLVVVWRKGLGEYGQPAGQHIALMNLDGTNERQVILPE